MQNVVQRKNPRLEQKVHLDELQWMRRVSRVMNQLDDISKYELVLFSKLDLFLLRRLIFKFKLFDNLTLLVNLIFLGGTLLVFIISTFHFNSIPMN